MTFTTPPEITDYKKPKEFKPTETTVAPNGDIYIADGYGKDFIIQYDAQGNYIRHFGGRGKLDEQFNCAHGITFDHRDPQNPSLLITSRSANEFKCFTLEGQYLETISLPGCYICRPVIKGNLIYFAVIITNKWDTFDGMLAVLDKNNKVISEEIMFKEVKSRIRSIKSSKNGNLIILTDGRGKKNSGKLIRVLPK